MATNLRITLLLLLVVLLVILMFYVRIKRRNIEAPSLVWLLLSVTIWCLATIVDLYLVSAVDKKIVDVFRYLGIVSIPVCFFYFVLEFTQRAKWFKIRVIWPFFVVPLTTIGMLITNDYHHLFYKIHQFEPIYKVSLGLWWKVHFMYSYALIVIALVVLVRMLLSSTGRKRRVALIVLISSILPFISHIVYVSRFTLVREDDITPILFALSGIVVFLGLYSKKLLAVKPIALNTLFNNMPDGIVVIDNNLIIVDVNHSAIELLGLADYKSTKRNINEVLPYKFDFTNQNALGKVHVVHFSKRYFEITHIKIRGDSNEDVGYLVVIKDISLRQLSQEKLRLATERLDLALQAAQLDSWENNLISGKIIGGTEIYKGIGYADDEIPNSFEDIHALIHPDDQLYAKKSLSQYLVGETQVYDCDFRVRGKSGSYYWLANYSRIIERDGQGKPTVIIGITQNINARKRTEENIKRKNDELVQANAEKEKFFSIIAHDLKGPFMGFIGLTELMARSIGDIDEAEMQDIAKSLNTTAKNLYELLENLLNWATIKRGHKSFSPQKFNLNDTILEVEEILQNQLTQKGLTLINEVDTNLKLLADRESVKSITRNLISNAIKFTPSGGVILVKTKITEKGMAEISVRDNGIGMPDDIKNNLFRISVKVSRPGTNNEPSTGLGLVLCKELVEKHGGGISVDSTEGEGSIFTFTLPAAHE